MSAVWVFSNYVGGGGDGWIILYTDRKRNLQEYKNFTTVQLNFSTITES